MWWKKTISSGESDLVILDDHRMEVVLELQSASQSCQSSPCLRSSWMSLQNMLPTTVNQGDTFLLSSVQGAVGEKGSEGTAGNDGARVSKLSSTHCKHILSQLNHKQGSHLYSWKHVVVVVVVVDALVQIQDLSQLVQRHVSTDLTAEVTDNSDERRSNQICFLSTGSPGSCWPTRTCWTQRWEGESLPFLSNTSWEATIHVTMTRPCDKFRFRKASVPRTPTTLLIFLLLISLAASDSIFQLVKDGLWLALPLQTYNYWIYGTAQVQWMVIEIIVSKSVTSLQGEPGPKGPHGPPGSRGVPVSKPVQCFQLHEIC